MSFSPIAAVAVASQLPQLPSTPSVMELGNQTLTVTDEVLDAILAAPAHTGGTQINRAALRELRAKDMQTRRPLTAEFYKALGFSSYAAIDVNSQYGSLVMDLNFDLREKYDFHQTFDLVTNNGTGEHLFDQVAVFKNVHALTKIGGLMLHIMPFVNWINHCFYNFHPLLYADLAAANNYELCSLGVANRWGFLIPFEVGEKSSAASSGSTPGGLERVVAKIKGKAGLQSAPASIPATEITRQIWPELKGTPLGRALRAVMDDEVRRTDCDFPNIMVVAALRKTQDAPFVIPMEGKYVGSIETPDIGQTYSQQYDAQQK